MSESPDRTPINYVIGADSSWFGALEELPGIERDLDSPKDTPPTK